ncbi:MAG: hypothetical protein RIQ79_1714 [Verrucomicrobiota bacterium]|jgi:hypothetical protein
MKHLFGCTIALVSSFFLAPHSYGLSVLWTKSIPVTNGSSLIYAIGEDGTFAVADANRNALSVSWYARSGVLLHTVTPQNPNSYGFVHVNKDEVVLFGRKPSLEYAMELFQAVDGQVTRTEVLASVSSISNGETFNYPYLLEVGLIDNVYSFKLYDLTSSVAPTIVGDAVIGVNGKNLQVRWKTLAAAVYKVQTSTDLATWTDYSDVLNGTGSTIVISIPLSDSSTSLYARVVKL